MLGQEFGQVTEQEESAVGHCRGDAGKERKALDLVNRQLSVNSRQW